MRVNRLLSLVAAYLMGLAPLHAVAQEADESVSVRDRARPEYDAQGMRLGGFDLNARLDVTVTSTDNLFAAETGEQDDIVYALAPQVNLSSHWSRHALSIDAGADFKNHADFATEDADTAYFGAFGRLDVGTASNFSANLRLAQEVEPRTNPDALTSSAPVEYTQEVAGFAAEHRFSRFRIRAGVNRADYDYDDAGLIDQDFRDHEETSFSGRLQAEITPRIGVVVQAVADQRDYDNAAGLSSDGRTYLAGISVDFTELMRGEFTMGQFDREYDSGATVDGTAVAGALEWYVTRLTTINLNARRSAEESGATTASPYIETAYSARVDHEFLRNVILTAGVESGRREYQAIDRDDDYLNVHLGGDYLLNRRVSLRARYAHSETESDGVNRYRDYEVNAVTVGVGLKL